MSAYTHHGDCSTSDPCERCFEFGQTTEQKRIIKLLEEHPIVTDFDGSTWCDHSDCDTETPWKSHAIAIIKGENK
ncbi:hypothetical protein UFOVP46_84 [uncultured Caudovirales phage]|uniref:Uncharacterized protein n=1 Tax=uncultured Caudovirales phage TaxID=2100421 RepID=A0A6J5KS48_9CAUD|nr:hypothetical protein UFOVP46_84 [uncultured Caudovirales phage]